MLRGVMGGGWLLPLHYDTKKLALYTLVLFVNSNFLSSFKETKLCFMELFLKQ
jgi:hypothetical protein